MRHRIVHDYFAVDYQRLWDTVHSDLPPLIEQLERILEDVAGLTQGRPGAGEGVSAARRPHYCSSTCRHAQQKREWRKARAACQRGGD